MRDSKLETRAKKSVFLGFSMGVQGYRIWRPETQKVKVSRDVKFEESSLLKQCQKENLQNMGKKIVIPQPVEIEGVKSQVETSPIAADGFDIGEDSTMQELEEDSIAVKRPSSEVKSPVR